MLMNMLENLIPLLVGLVVVIAIGVAFRKSKRGSVNGGEYDERQEMIRGRIYRRAFLVVAALSALYGCVIELGGKSVMHDGVAPILIALTGIGFFAVNCVLAGAFFGAKQKPGLYLLISGICVVSSTTGSIGSLLAGECVQDGMLTFACLPLAVAAVFLAVFLTIVYTEYIRKEAEDE